MIRRRQLVAISIRGFRHDLFHAGRKRHTAAYPSGVDDCLACGGDLARESASRSVLRSEKHNRIESGSLTAFIIGIHRQELGSTDVAELREEVVAVRMLTGSRAQDSEHTYIGTRHGMRNGERCYSKTYRTRTFSAQGISIAFSGDQE